MSRYAIVSIIFWALLLGSLALDGILEVSIWWYVVLVAGYLMVTIYGSAVMSAQYFLRSVQKSQTEKDCISITFDDGPVQGMTEKILDILKTRSVRSAFFCIGQRVEQHPDLVKRIHEEGHVIGNHSYTHRRTFDLMPSAGVIQELLRTNESIKNCIGVTPKFFRPPYGVTNPMIAKAVARTNFKVVGWSVRSFDTLFRNKSKLYARVTRKLKGGDIVLFHDYCQSTIEMLPEFLDFVEKRGLKIVRVDELVKEKAYA
jgi:peptidoglycan/xylan/chitin deacetylase (PgdA/CDA1 family)